MSREPLRFVPVLGRRLGRDIATEVATYHGMTLDDLRGPRRKRKFVLARQEAMWRVRYETRLSLPAIGRLLNRDHSTVLHGVNAHEARTYAEALAAE